MRSCRPDACARPDCTALPQALHKPTTSSSPADDEPALISDARARGSAPRCACTHVQKCTALVLRAERCRCDETHCAPFHPLEVVAFAVRGDTVSGSRQESTRACLAPPPPRLGAIRTRQVGRNEARPRAHLSLLCRPLSRDHAWPCRTCTCDSLTKHVNWTTSIPVHTQGVRRHMHAPQERPDVQTAVKSQTPSTWRATAHGSSACNGTWELVQRKCRRERRDVDAVVSASHRQHGPPPPLVTSGPLYMSPAAGASVRRQHAHHLWSRATTSSMHMRIPGHHGRDPFCPRVGSRELQAWECPNATGNAAAQQERSCWLASGAAVLRTKCCAAIGNKCQQRRAWRLSTPPLGCVSTAGLVDGRHGSMSQPLPRTPHAVVPGC